MHNLKETTNLEFHQSYDAQCSLYLKSNPDNSWCELLKYYKNVEVTRIEHTEKLFEIGDLALWKKSIFDDTHKKVKEYANR